MGCKKSQNKGAKKAMKKLLSILIALVVILALIAVPVGAAIDEDETVTTGATVDGGGSPPFICCKFETPDHDTASGTQVLPKANANRKMKFYVVVGDPNSIDDIASVDVTVKYPDTDPWYGEEKFQLRAIKGEASWVVIPWDGMIDTTGNCTGDTPVEEAMTELNAQGRITYGPGQDLGTVLYDLEYGKQILVELMGLMDSHQPSCDYTVEARATDMGGATSDPVINTFFYMSIVALKIDFTEVAWNGVNICQWNYLLGDEDMSTTARPTVKNVGNDMGMLQIEASPLLGAVHGKTIEEFDAEMDEKDLETGVITVHGRIQFLADTPTIITEEPWDTPGPPIKLVPCQPTQLDLSVHPPTGTIADTYTGTMTLTILHWAP
jgi:hypothetical protein